MQWASSTAKSMGLSSSSSGLEVGGEEPLRRDVEQPLETRARSCAHHLPPHAPALSELFSSSAGIPSSRNCWTWSSISEISGDTTIVSPSCTAAGKLIAQALARPGGHDAQHVPAGQHVLDHLALGGAEIVEAEQVCRSRSSGSADDSDGDLEAVASWAARVVRMGGAVNKELGSGTSGIATGL